MVGYALCGSYCTHQKSLSVLEKLTGKHDVIPIVSENVFTTDTRFGKASDIIERLEILCRRSVIHTITEAEPLGPVVKLEALIICPCTGNTLAKLANGITDTAVCMAAKAHLRSDRPLIIALATNDATSANLENIAKMLNRKNVWFVPMAADDSQGKPHSLVADFARVEETLDYALENRQICPVFC